MAIRLAFALLIAMGTMLVLGPPARPALAATLTVTSTADEPDSAPGNGICAGPSGACTLRAAVMEANALGGSNRITLPAGTFTLTIAGRGEEAAATGDLDVNGGRLEVVGAGVGSTIINPNQLDRAFHLGPLTPTLFSLSDVTIQNGNVVSSPPNPGTAGPDIGGAIRVERNSGLAVEDARFVNNAAGARGGAIGMPTNAGTTTGVDPNIVTRLTRVTMENNTAGVEAGGFFNNRNAFLSEVKVLKNRVTGGVLPPAQQGTERGGGIASSGDITLTNVVVDGNTMGAGNGGGIGNRGDPAAGIFGTLRLTNVTVSNNQSELGGGIANGNGATMFLTNTTISGNRAIDQPGGVPAPSVTAGGIVNLGTATLTYVTLANNASAVGGGLVTVGPPLGSSSARTTLRGTILSRGAAGGNCLLPSPAIPFARAPISAGDNISSDNSCELIGPNDRNGIDPLLEALANNGGFTPTHALRQGSPAIDAVLGGCPPPSTDQREVSRPQAARCDVGAFEFEAGAANDANNDDDDDDKKETEEQRQQRERTNRSNRDDERTEGNVVAVACDAAPPTVSVANRDGVVLIVLQREARKVCSSITVGAYIEVDGQKEHEFLFYADDVTISKR